MSGRPCRAVAFLTAALIVTSFSTTGLTASAQSPPAVVEIPPTDSAPAAPPAEICGNPSFLDGPSEQPPGSVRVDPGTNLNDATRANPPGTTFWLSPGVHTLSDLQFGQVIPRDGNTYIGAPGSVIDGRNINRYAFTQQAENVTLRYLTIENFVSPNAESVVNHDSGDSWTVEYSTIRNNNGAGLGLGSNTVVRYNCLQGNGQYGFNVSRPFGTVNLVLDHNEIAYNAADDFETNQPGCGCSGGGKFWGVTGAVVTNNWVHHNLAQGLFVDTNAIGFRIEGNYIEENASEGIIYETSYNALIKNNTLKRNALRKGAAFASRNSGFPVAAIYIQEGGGDPRVFDGVYSTLEISGNVLEDNWGGVVVWENADRFCNTAGSTADGYCPVAGVATVNDCVAGTISSEPYTSDCRWKSQNVLVRNNDFKIDKAAISCTNNCGIQGLFSNPGSYPSWSPYLGNVVQEAITKTQNNRFADNRYEGDWRYDIYSIGNVVDLATWQSAPWFQDLGSTYNGVTPPTPTTTTTEAPTTTTTEAPTTTTTTTTVPPPTNALNADTATLEGGLGAWVRWFSSSISRSTVSANTGSASLKVDVTAPYGWGVTQSNHPGFPVTPGDKTISFWGRSSGTGLSATMTVHWRNASGLDLKVDTLNLDLGDAWRQATATVTAPAGTERVRVDFSNRWAIAGDSLYLDDISILPSASPPPPPEPAINELDIATSTLEGSKGRWVRWFSADASRTTAQAHGGDASLAVNITAPHGWGVTLQNYPGFLSSPGEKTIGFWAMTTSGPGLSATMRVTFRNEARAILGTEVLSLPLTDSWQQASAVVTAPVGTTRVSVDFSHQTGKAGDTIFLDDISVMAD